MPKIFISYRRDDSLHPSGRIYKEISRAFGAKNVFKDVDNIPLGRDFRGVLIEAVSQCDVMLVIIGRQWLSIQDEHGQRRLDNFSDFVRIEVETGLQRHNCTVIPVLVDGATMPRADDLPLSLRELAFNQNAVIKNDPDFDHDVERLIRELRQFDRPSLALARPKFSSSWLLAFIVGLLAVGAILALWLGGILGGDDEAAQHEVPTATNTDIITAAPTEDAEDTNTPRPSATNAETLTNTAQPTATDTIVLTNTSRPSATNTDLPTSTAQPTATDTVVPTNTPDVFALAQSGVTSNDEWMPYEQEFDGIPMMLVPAGCFMMGENGEGGQQCFADPFWLDKFEVTNVLYGSVGCESYSSQADEPRNCVDWSEAQAYCEDRGAEYRLPTEAEWEYAARGPDGLIYPWGNEFVAENVVYVDNSGNKTVAVGSRPEGASWVGAMDMSGNVWEWLLSWYADYPYDKSDGREALDNSNNYEYRVLRGGSFVNASYFVRAANRNWSYPVNEIISFGFRCARSYK